MDVLKPEIVLVDGRCYRFFDSTSWSQNRELGSYEEESFQATYDSDQEVCDGNIEIFAHSGGRYKHSFHVPRAIYPFIIGQRGATKKRFETETKTTIQVPKQGEDGDIIIIGADRRKILSARNRIDLLVETSRKKMPFTHFLSIPMNKDNIIRGFNQFKSEVLNKTAKGARGVNESIFQTDKKLHLTLDVLKLLDNEERKLAAKKLLACREDIIKPFLKENGPINIEVRGIECMNDDPAEVNVLYAIIVDKDGYLQDLSERIVDYFVEEGLIQRQYNRVKLHMTIMNIRFSKKDDDESANERMRETFDASNILKVHKNTFFGKTTLSTLHLSQRHTKNDSGYYKETEKIEF
ncbi:activating signal cointegrator 1 complex subunit 1-like [Belonocnema kinseyi]|uniref:activating signal cointegrator 1 complex subunit 1-like n=1 Tax=Belonocnema kinseyi TaxID=2817044 RepID=UPI00143D8623|nr:activating signal cointegrator 1 complex subunit 1-like [Belonocnema kinseyi]XP_033228167.1 activating signal cointegrator 1 complex subunit 1-like [Belonocnema kinseyi]